MKFQTPLVIISLMYCSVIHIDSNRPTKYHKLWYWDFYIDELWSGTGRDLPLAMHGKIVGGLELFYFVNKA